MASQLQDFYQFRTTDEFIRWWTHEIRTRNGCEYESIIEDRKLEAEKCEAEAKLEVEKRESHEAEAEAKLEIKKRESEAKFDAERREAVAKLEAERRETREIETRLALDQRIELENWSYNSFSVNTKQELNWIKSELEVILKLLLILRVKVHRVIVGAGKDLI